MNRHIVLSSVGILLLMLALTMAAAVALSLALPAADGRHESLELGGWFASIGITLTSSLGLLFFGRRRGPRRQGAEIMLRKEAVAVVGIAWLVCPIHAALPYMLCAPTMPADKAIFEAVSGLTTTGATVIRDIEAEPKTLLLWRSASQWLGGIGILAMFVLVLSGSGTSGRRMFGTESSLHSSDLTLSNIRQTMRALWLLYAALTLLCGLGLWALGLTPFQAVNHSMTTTATAGFGTENDSIDGFGTPVRLWLIVFMLGCGISFPLYIVMLKRRSLDLLKHHEETWWYLGIFALATLLVLASRAIDGFDEQTVAIVFNVTSLLTTTGYTVGDYDSWSIFAKQILLLLMVIGGCSGSTAGGLKVSRFVLWFRLARVELTRSFRPKIVLRLTMNGRPVPESTLGQLFVVFTMAGFFFIAGSLAMRLFEPDTSTFGCISATVACLCNIGPAFAEFGPTRNFAGLSTPSTLFLPVLMILGRLEYIAVLVLFSRKLWRHY